MKKRLKIILSIVLPIICIASVCLSFLLPMTKADSVEPTIENAITAEDTGASTADKSKKGGVIYIEEGATYNMRGGNISGQSNVYGGAVYVSKGSTFNMMGGTIKNCFATYGGAIYVESGGKVNITGGSIIENFAEYASAIYVEAGGELNISENTQIEGVGFSAPIGSTIFVGNPAVNCALPYLELGSYPQTYVGSEMNSTLEQWYNNSKPDIVTTYEMRDRVWYAYRYTDGELYARGKSFPFNSSYTYLNGESVGYYGKTCWFKIEPIKWVMMNYDKYMSGEENLELMSYLILTGYVYFNEAEAETINWETSYARGWLNNSFYATAFNDEEKQKISKAQVTNTVVENMPGEAYKYIYTNVGATEDYVYLPSHEDCSIGDIFQTGSNQKRLCSPTDFAVSNFCEMSVDSGYPTNYRPNGGTGLYWTRSVPKTQDSAFCIENHGGLCTQSSEFFRIGLRPMMQLNIEKGLLGTTIKGGLIYLGEQSTFVMDGGSLSVGESQQGGAVYVGAGASFIFNNGTIENSVALYGNGVYVQDGGYLEMIEDGEFINCGEKHIQTIYAENLANVKRPVAITLYVDGESHSIVNCYSNDKIGDLNLSENVVSSCNWYIGTNYNEETIIKDDNYVGKYATGEIVSFYLANHNYVVISNTATCTQSGIKTIKCSYCGDTAANKSPALGHSSTTETVEPPTCTENGSIKIRCRRCNVVISEEVLIASHEWAPYGSAQHKCSKCLEVASHNLQDKENGDAECTICNYVKHTWGHNAVYVHVCTNCEYAEKHNCSVGFRGWHSCSICGNRNECYFEDGSEICAVCGWDSSAYYEGENFISNKKAEETAYINEEQFYFNIKKRLLLQLEDKEGKNAKEM